MPLSFLPYKNRIANIVFKDYVIRYVEVKQGTSPILHAYGEHYLPQGVIKDGKINDYETLLAILEQLVDEWKLSRKQVRFLVPNSYVVIRKVIVPMDIHDDEIEGYLYLELGTNIHLPFENPVFDVVVLNEKEEGKEILLFASKEDIVSEFNDLLEECKLRPIAADISPLALYRLYSQKQMIDEKEHLMLIDLDVISATVTVFTADNPIFIRHIPLSIGLDSWEIVRKREEDTLVCTNEKTEYLKSIEDIYTEIDRVLDFYQYKLSTDRKAVTKVLLNGDHPYLEDIYEEFVNRLKLPVIFWNDELITVKQETVAPKYQLAAGLAIKGGN